MGKTGQQILIVAPGDWDLQSRDLAGVNSYALRFTYVSEYPADGLADEVSVED